MAQVREIMEKLVRMSALLSSKGLIEEASLQEASALLAAAAVNGEATIVSVGYEGALESVQREKQSSAEIIERLSSTDGIVWVKTEEGNFSLAMYWVDSHEAFDSLPVFLQNYVAEEIMPQLICICVEEISRHQKTEGLEKAYYALPFIMVLQCNASTPSFTLAFAGQERRMRVQQNPQAQWDEGMSTVRPFFLMMGSALQQLQAPASLH